MTFMPNPTRQEREIAKVLGVTTAGLEVLRRINRGDNISGNVAGTKLLKQGYLLEGSPRQLSFAGRLLLRQARSMGF
jgi:hypothetical protein